MATTAVGTNTDMIWQEVFQFETAVLETIDNITQLSVIVNENDVSDIHQPNLAYGSHKTGPGTTFGSWSILTKLKGSYFRNDDYNLSLPFSAGLYFTLVKELADVPGVLSHRVNKTILNDPQNQTVNWNAVTGRRVDGISLWEVYPYRKRNAVDSNIIRTSDQEQLLYFPVSELPEAYASFWVSNHGSGNHFKDSAEYLFDYGFYMWQTGIYVGAGFQLPGNGETLKFSPTLERMKIYYQNCVVNSFDSMTWSIGQNFTMRGKGFTIPNASLNMYGRALGWNDRIETVNFIGKQNQGTFTVTTPSLNYDNDQVTITAANMPALPDGTYEINIVKRSDVWGVLEYPSFAGDYRCTDEGQLIKGSRLILLVGEGDGDGDPILLTEWEITHLDESIFRYLAPIDVRSPDIFYDGYILNVSSLKRAINDRTGLYSVSDMTLDLANNDKEWSKMMAQYIMKNAHVSIFHAWGTEPHGWRTRIHRMIVDDYELEADKFRVFLKDITKKYFELKIPEYFITSEEYPDAHEDAIGKGMSDILGENSLLGTADDPVWGVSSPGSFEAYCIDKTNFYYLASRGSLHAIPEVYSDDVKMATPGDYSVNYRDGGRTYIDFVGDQGDKKITFNAEGYMFGAWNSVNGYIQNPARILQFILMILLHVPVELINMISFDDMADYFEDKEYETSAKFWACEPKKAEEKLSDFLFTFGIKLYPDREGRMSIGIKDESNYQSDYYIFEQLDCIDPARNMPQLKRAENYVRYKWDEHQAAKLFLKADSKRSELSISDFGDSILEARGSPWKFPYTTNETLVAARVNDELLKRAYGEKWLKIKIPIHKIEDLDIFDNFRFQSLYAPSFTGAGQAGWYYYIIDMEYNWSGNSIIITAVDLGWLMGQCMIIGKFSELERDWMDANVYQRTFAYIGNCATGTFEDGVPNKKICDCYE
jgi:hypothetical protein